MGDQVSADGNPLFASFIQLSDGVPRLSSFGSLLNGESGVKIYPNVVGLYSDLSENGQQVGNLVGLIGTDQTGGDSAGKLLLNTRNGLQSLNFANVQQIGSLSLGEWTNGQASVVNSYLGSSQQLNLTASQFMPYIVGTTAEKNLGNNMKFSYVLAGATPTRAGTQVGELTKLNINIDLNLMPLVSVDMAASLANVTYSAQLSNTPLLDISFDQKFSGFILSGAANGLYARSSTAALCADNKCPVNLSAFLSGNDMGVVYEIKNSGLNTIAGVAALTGTESSIEKVVTSLPDDCCLPSSLAGTYTALFNTNNNTINIASKVDNLAAVFDSKSEALLSAFHVVKEGNKSLRKRLLWCNECRRHPCSQYSPSGSCG
jgi:hypothetical protein